MTVETYRAYWIEEKEDGTFQRSVKELPIGTLGESGVLMKVEYAALNYKDALSASGHKGITKRYPHTPGVDAAGSVVEDDTGTFSRGDLVLITGRDLGMNTKGGFGEYIRVPADWLVPMPKGLNTYNAMVMGTGAFTSGLALYKMELNGQHPGMGPILITGASGGVGSMAVAICSRAGYEVIASTGKDSAHDYLRALGASKIIGREDVNIESNRPLLRSFFAGAIDTVGGNTLSTLLKSCAAKGMVATTGLVDSPYFSSNVYPFIIKGISLLGIDSAETESSIRLKVWEKISGDWKPELIDKIGTMIELDQLDQEVQNILQGKTRGRIVVKHAHK